MLNYQDYIHPEDEAARRNMEALPGFTELFKTYMKLGYEKYLYGINLASKIRLSEKQLPEIYALLPPVCKKLGIDIPELYLEMDPNPNAGTFGDTRIFISVTSGLVESLTPEELIAVLAHECGHIKCRHVLYHTMATELLVNAGKLGLIGQLSTPLQWALLYWERKSELSCDRASALVTGNPQTVVDVMVRLAGGPRSITEKVNINEYIKQAEEYDKLKDNVWNNMLQTAATIELSHPFNAVRTREILNWCETDQYKRLIENLNLQENGKACPHCTKPVEADWKFCKYCGEKL